MNQHFSENALLTLRAEIDGAGGNEVFFRGRTDENRVVVEVEALARGNRDAVAAVMPAVSWGDVVIHNHPSGGLTPSGADVEIASILGAQGVGFFIIDNGATRCNVVVTPFARRETTLLSHPEIQDILSPEGLLSRHLEGYEHREEQVRMAWSVADAFNRDEVAVIEAGTGTGKSLAYLLPSILWSVRNKERVVISTNTINLQDQLIRKDIPFLQKRLGCSFSAVLLKGRGNYVCRRKLQGVKLEPALFPDEHQGELKAILEWSAKTSEGCRGDLSFIPKDEVWEEVACEGDQCSRVKCSFYSSCFFYSARRQAAAADLLVVNHALLMADAALRPETGYNGTGVLPPFDRIIFDEGHHLEEVATGHLSVQISRNGLLKLLGRLKHPRKQQAGLLPRFLAQLSKEIPEHLDAIYIDASGQLELGLLPAVAELAEEVTAAMDTIGLAMLEHLKPASRKGEHKLRLVGPVYYAPVWEECATRLAIISKKLHELATGLKNVSSVLGKLPEPVLEKFAGTLTDLKGLRSRVEQAMQNISFFTARDQEFCRWFELKVGQKGMALKLCAAPLEVAGALKSVIFQRFKTVVLTSATLAVGGDFSYLKGRTGISLLPPQRVTELLLPSPFDYRRQAFVGIPSDVPEPVSPKFSAILPDLLLEGLQASGGRAFVLFTSYDLLMRMHRALEPKLKRLGMTPMRQGELNRHLLLEKFRKSTNPVLFGTDSFWEGVDVKGKALELVVITRLPFRVPTEPVLEARAEDLERRGGDPFIEFTIPQAVIKFKQGFGRLIRSRDDRGAVLILDSRVLNRGYGRFFLDSLPEVEPASVPAGEMFGRLRSFFVNGEQ